MCVCVRVACVTEGGLVGTCSRLSFSVPASRRVAADSELASPEPPSLQATRGRVPGRPASKGSRHPSDRHPGLVRAAAERRLVGVAPLTHQTRRQSRRRLPLNEADSTRAFFFFFQNIQHDLPVLGSVRERVSSVLGSVFTDTHKTPSNVKLMTKQSMQRPRVPALQPNRGG